MKVYTSCDSVKTSDGDNARFFMQHVPQNPGADDRMWNEKTAFPA